MIMCTLAVIFESFIVKFAYFLMKISLWASTPDFWYKIICVLFSGVARNSQWGRGGER